MINLLSGLFSKITTGTKEQMDKPVPKAKSAAEIMDLIQKNVQDFTIEKRTVDCTKIDNRYYSQLFDAIDRSKSVQELILSGDVRKDDVLLITTRMTDNNNISVITLFIDFSDELNFEVTNLLTKSKSIKTLKINLLSDDSESDEYRRRLEAVSEGINNSTSINAIQIANPGRIQPEAMQPLLDAISKNQIHSLRMEECGSLIGTIVSQLHQSSITDLSIYESVTIDIGTIVQLAELIAKNRNIRMLDISSTRINDRTIGPLVDAIKNSKNLKQLVLSNMCISEPFVADIIAYNTSITSILWYGSEGVDLEKFSDALKKNSTLTRLDLRGKFIASEGYKHLGEAMKVNNTLKKLIISHSEARLKLELHPLFDGLKFNTGLNVLEILGRFSSLWYPVSETLKTNRALIEITKGYNEDKLHPQLILNKQSQDEVVLGGKSLVRAIYWHTNSFLTLLPLELWFVILSYVRHPGVALDFEVALKELFRRKNDSNNVMTRQPMRLIKSF